MADNSWVLKGVDTETRQQAVAEAERRGVSLADYLTDVVLQRALLEQALVGEPATEEAPPPAPAAPEENFFVRHRLESLERRVHLAMGGLDSAVHALDSSVFGLAGRVDEAEVLAADTADRLDQAIQDTGANLTALRKRLADAEEQADGLSEAHDALSGAFAERCAALDQHVLAVEDAARAANTSAAQLAVAHEALKYAVADDFSALARETAERVATGLDDVRAAADAAAEQADAAVAHLISELRSVREAVEERLQESVADTRARMHEAFVDAADRMTLLSERVTDCERLTVRSAEHLRAQMADIEDGAQTALEETAETLRQAGAALAAECARVAHDTRAAIESVHGDLSSEIAEVRDRQAAGFARLKALDATLANTQGETAALREALETRAAHIESATHGALAHAHADWDARFDAFAARLANSERDAADAHSALRAESERVEACAFAALEKLARDRVGGDATLARDISQVNARLDSECRDLRELNTGVLARIKLLETGAAPIAERLAQVEAALSGQDGDVIGRIAELEELIARNAAHGAQGVEIAARVAGLEKRVDAGAIDDRLLRLEAAMDAQRDVADRLDRLEAAAESEETEHEIAALRGQLAGLAAQIEARQADDSLAQRLDELRTRVFAYEAQAGEAADRAHGMARMLGRLSTSNAEATAQAEARMHKLELAIAELRVEPDIAGVEAIQELDQRVTAFEARQADTFERLRADIAHFLGENDRRLEALENAPAAESHEVANEFDALRRRIEERILGVEQRSIRALEQVADTMAVLEKRIFTAPEAAARSA